LGNTDPAKIEQRGEKLDRYRTNFELIDVRKGLRLDVAG
jgi:hypothetical protein